MSYTKAKFMLLYKCMACLLFPPMNICLVPSLWLFNVASTASTSSTCSTKQRTRSDFGTSARYKFVQALCSQYSIYCPITAGDVAIQSRYIAHVSRQAPETREQITAPPGLVYAFWLHVPFKSCANFGIRGFFFREQFRH